ncbi:lanthionine synthetase LanC family protein [Streptomyces sp. MS06]|uniref:class III lanthionine synthetase LanKC N-terminal domain-containing protein n=1 Tax=Streptomyces sp. MS06 TaxID=3385974 RepID=UPI0039A3B166
MSLELFTVADRDHYAPPAACAQGQPRLRPAAVPEHWTAVETGLWTDWTPAGKRYGDGSVRVTAAARAGREQHVLDAFAAVCFARAVPFRHVSTTVVRALLDGEHGSRPQAGRFCIAAPADPPEAEKLLTALHTALRGETGPVPPTGRRHRDSRVLRWDESARPAPCVLRPDGLRCPAGEDDLLDGPEPAPTAPEGYVPVRLLDAANTGYTFLARDPRDDREVLVEQRFAHSGVDGDGRSALDRLGERYEALLRFHAGAPGHCPRPLDHRTDGESAWLVTQPVAGVPLSAWIVAHSPMADSSATPAHWSAYYRRAAGLLDRAREALARLQQLGAAIGRIGPHDVLVGRDDRVAFTGLTAAPAPAPAPAPAADPDSDPDPAPPEHGADDLTDALGRLALPMLTPAAPAAALDAGVLPHVRRDLERRQAPVPRALWSTALRGAGPAGEAPLPAPERVDADERAALAELRDRIAAGVVGAAEDAPWHMFPTVPQGYLSNTLGVAYGAAGVLHALRIAGTPAPDWVPARLRRDALAQAHRLPPGLLSGLAGIAWVLADLGRLDEAAELLAEADRHPLTRTSATLAWGGSGVALAHLALYGHTGELHHLDRAAEFACRLPESSAALSPLLGPGDMTGLWYGRTGVAHALQQLAAVTDDETLLRHARGLLHAELDRAVEERGELSFPASARDRRKLYYLYCGTAGFLTAAARQSAAMPDERLAGALPKLIRKASMTQVAHAGLGNGLAGLGFALSECGRILDDPTARAAARSSARALFGHAVPRGRSAHVLGDLRLRFSSELWSGGAGVLLFLAHLLDELPDPLFTVDALAATSRGAVPA